MNFVGFAICTGIDCNPKHAKQTNHRLERVFLRNKSVRSTIGAKSREPLGRKPGAMAIGPAPNGSCCPAGIADLLGPKRSVLGGLVKSPNRLRWLAHGVAKLNPVTVPAFCLFKID